MELLLYVESWKNRSCLIAAALIFPYNTFWEVRNKIHLEY